MNEARRGDERCLTRWPLLLHSDRQGGVPVEESGGQVEAQHAEVTVEEGDAESAAGVEIEAIPTRAVGGMENLGAVEKDAERKAVDRKATDPTDGESTGSEQSGGEQSATPPADAESDDGEPGVP